MYAGAVEKVTGGNPASGSEVIVTDWKDCAIAWGELLQLLCMHTCMVL